MSPIFRRILPRPGPLILPVRHIVRFARSSFLGTRLAALSIGIAASERQQGVQRAARGIVDVVLLL